MVVVIFLGFYPGILGKQCLSYFKICHSSHLGNILTLASRFLLFQVVLWMGTCSFAKMWAPRRWGAWVDMSTDAPSALQQGPAQHGLAESYFHLLEDICLLTLSLWEEPSEAENIDLCRGDSWRCIQCCLHLSTVVTKAPHVQSQIIFNQGDFAILIA